MILLMVLASVVLIFLLAWLRVEKSRRRGVPRVERQRGYALLELIGSAVLLLDFVEDGHSASRGFAGAFGLLLLGQSIYTVLKSATRSRSEPE